MQAMARTTNETKRIIVVLGMHRSGTSALTKGLQLLGVDLGDNLMPAVAGNNDKGFWEDWDINALNVKLLHQLESEWHLLGLAELERSQAERLAAYAPVALELLRGKLENAAIFGMKDPRMARLLPFWQAVFRELAIPVGYVLAVRNPLSVAQSLAKRDQFDPVKSYYLWLEHMIPAVLHTQHCQRVVVDYDCLVENPAAQLQRIAQAMELPFCDSSTDFCEYAEGYLEAGLRHTTYSLQDLTCDIMAPVETGSTYALLQQLARDEISAATAEFFAKIEEIGECVARLSPVLHFMNRQEAWRSGLQENTRQIVAAQEEQITNLQQKMERQERLTADMLQSRSWKMTQPLRDAAGFGRRLLGKR